MAKKRLKKPFNVHFGNVIRELRHQRGWSMEYICDEVGLAYSTFSYIERGVNSTSIEKAHAICKSLDTSISWVLASVDRRIEEDKK